MAKKRNLTKIIIGNTFRFLILILLGGYITLYSLQSFGINIPDFSTKTTKNNLLPNQHFALPNYVNSKKSISITPQTFQNKFEVDTPIMIYHRITVDPDILNNAEVKSESLALTPAKFETDIKNFQDLGYAFEYPSDILAELNNKKDVKNIVISIDDGVEDVYQNVFPVLKKYNAHAILYIISGVINDDGYMTYDQIKEMLDSGLVKLGAHTVNHAQLDKLSVSDQRYEIAKSKFDLEYMFHQKITDFAFPYGMYNDDTLKLVEEAGFETAVNSDNIPLHLESLQNRYGWNRINSSLTSDYSVFGIKK